MRYVLASLIMAVMVVVAAQYAGAAMGEDGKANSVMYACGCGPGCKCQMMADEPGQCRCGKDMDGMHMLGRDGSTGVFCTCGPECTCKIDPNDPTMCGCGKKVRKMDISGMYVCACGEECDCNSISMKPGKCRCGREMMKVE